MALTMMDMEEISGKFTSCRNKLNIMLIHKLSRGVYFFLITL